MYKSSNNCSLGFIGLKARNLRKAKGIPLILHNHGKPCWPINDYLLDAFINSNLSLSTIETYGRQLSRLLAFMDSKRIGFNELTDDSLFELADYLADKTNAVSNKGPANNNQISKIIARTCWLVYWLQNKRRSEVTSEDNIPAISQDFEVQGRINIDFRIYDRAKNTRKGNNKFEYIYHPSQPRTTNPQKRSPAKECAIEELWDSISKSNSSKFVKSRFEAILTALEYTGGRDSEIVSITVAALRKALRTDSLSIYTTKGGKKGNLREVPIDREVIKELLRYADNERKEVIKSAIKTGKINKDHGFLFVTSRGNPQSPKSISDEVGRFRRAARIVKPIHPHLFRHRFITIQVAMRLKDFLGNPLKGGNLTELILERVRPLTGHSSISNMLHYVDLAFEELGIWKKVDSEISEKLKDSCLIRKCRILVEQAKNDKKNSDKYLSELIEIFA